MVRGQKLENTQTPIASDEDVAKGFTSGLTTTIEASKKLMPKEVGAKRIGCGSMPRKGVWGRYFQKP